MVELLLVQVLPPFVLPNLGPECGVLQQFEMM